MKHSGHAARIAYTALFLSLSLVLSWLEMQLPQAPFLPPGVKLGLSNVVTMYCLFFVNAPSAFLVAFLKSLFAFLMRGSFAGFSGRTMFRYSHADLLPSFEKADLLADAEHTGSGFS